jgi:hypothetical protein
LSVAALIVLGCAAAGAVATPTVPPPTTTPTSTATLPPPTSTPRPTPTPTATPTLIPTPAAVGDKVQYGNLEITLIGVDTHDLIVPGGLYYYYPTDRSQYFLDLGVLISDVEPGHTTTIAVPNVYIVEEDGGAHYPGFLDKKIVDRGTKFDPFEIGIATQTSDNSQLFIARDTYVRLVFVIGKNQMILFGIADSPQIAFQVP